LQPPLGFLFAFRSDGWHDAGKLTDLSTRICRFPRALGDIDTARAVNVDFPPVGMTLYMIQAVRNEGSIGDIAMWLPRLAFD
jgi:hypothetical protein